MIILNGKYNQAIIYSDEVESGCQKQIISLLNHPMSKEAQIRIMPDVHAGAGCVIGYTSTITDLVVPNLVGVDLGCGIAAAAFDKLDVDLKEIDDFIRENIPLGTNIRENPIKIPDDFQKEIIKVAEETGQSIDYVLGSMATLGGGK